MKKAIVVFTNNSSLEVIGINQSIPVFPKKIIINKNLSVFLFSDSDEKPELQFIADQFDEVYVIHHVNGSFNKKIAADIFKTKLKDSRTHSHIKDSGNYYDKQLRTILEHVVVDEDEDEDVHKPWTLGKDASIDEEFLLKPFNDDGLEMIMLLLQKLLAGNFGLDDEEQSLLKENDFDLEGFKSSFNRDSPDWESFNELRDKLTSKLTSNL